jgi:hypothetical protein
VREELWDQTAGRRIGPIACHGRRVDADHRQ